ncbi:MAG TPA: redoxin domain-containing protein, partial [Planctomycetota bacterium]|nr:redoxin domain-containing protein [Planctomycetota bacterium]
MVQEATSAAQRTLPRIGDIAPDFHAQTTHGEIDLHAWAGDHWVVLFSHPADFTPVCSTELTELGRMNEEFARRKTKLIGVSVDSIHSHLAWVQNLEQILGVRLPYPLVADSDRKVSALYGMLHPQESATATVRALFFIDPAKKIRAVIYYPL